MYCYNGNRHHDNSGIVIGCSGSGSRGSSSGRGSSRGRGSSS
jgi:hypothetical protein